MEGQVPASQQPDLNPGRPPMTPENLEALKEEARRRAIMQAMQDQQVRQGEGPEEPARAVTRVALWQVTHAEATVQVRRQTCTR